MKYKKTNNKQILIDLMRFSKADYYIVRQVTSRFLTNFEWFLVRSRQHIIIGRQNHHTGTNIFKTCKKLTFIYSFFYNTKNTKCFLRVKIPVCSNKSYMCDNIIWALNQVRCFWDEPNELSNIKKEYEGNFSL
jgi:hypothetical protein